MRLLDIFRSGLSLNDPCGAWAHIVSYTGGYSRRPWSLPWNIVTSNLCNLMDTFRNLSLVNIRLNHFVIPKMHPLHLSSGLVSSSFLIFSLIFIGSLVFLRA